MSKGPGRVQRAILALIEAKPDGAWSFEQLCRLVYDDRKPSRAELSAIGRALQRMPLPGTWTTGGAWGDRRSWLYDKCNLASARRMHLGYHKDHFEPGGQVFEQVEKAKRFRDAAPLERIEMQISDVRARMAQLKMLDALSPSAMKEAAERIEELKREMAALASPALTA